MKVKISYSVNLEEVMGLIKRVYAAETVKYNYVREKARVILHSDFDESQISTVLLHIKQLREAMASMDLTLAEMGNMLMGYEQICLSDSETDNNKSEEDTSADA